MSKQVQEAYIVAATRSPIGRSHRGFFRNTRPDDLLVKVLQAALAADLTVGRATPQLVLAGLERSSAFSWDATARTLWQSIERTAHQ